MGNLTDGEKLAALVAKKRCEFAALYHTTTRGERLDFEKFYFLSDLYADPSTDIVLVCAAQSGKTEWVVVDALALISLGVDYQLVQPKDDLRVLFSRTRIDPQRERCQIYKDNISSTGKLYNWVNGTLRIVFSNREDEMIAFPADCVGVDELDRCDLKNISLLPDRMLNSPFRLWRRSSTPTTEGNDSCQNIWWHFMESDQLKYHIPCQHCGFEQELSWLKNFVEERRDEKTGKLLYHRLMDSNWNETKERDILPICTSCGLAMNRLDRGKYYPTVLKPHKVGKRGYHIGKLLNPIIPVREHWSDYLSSVNNPFKLQRFYNSILGLPYVGEGTKITEQMIYSCVQDYVIQTNNDKYPQRTSMGVDVHPEYLDVRVSGYPYKGTRIRKLLFAGKLRTFTQLHDIVERFNVFVCTVDAEPETREALQFQQYANCRVYVCHVREKQGQTLSDLLMDKVQQEKRFTIDRTLLMDSVLQTWVQREHEVPKNLAFLCEGKWLMEMINPTRVLEIDEKGREKYVWTHGMDHSFMADVFDFCSMVLGGFDSEDLFKVSEKRPLISFGDPFEMDVAGMMG